jgi:hypothetical protein
VKASTGHHTHGLGLDSVIVRKPVIYENDYGSHPAHYVIRAIATTPATCDSILQNNFLVNYPQYLETGAGAFSTPLVLFAVKSGHAAKQLRPRDASKSPPLSVLEYATSVNDTHFQKIINKNSPSFASNVPGKP